MKSCMDWHLWRVYAASTVSLSVHAEPGGKHKIKAKYKSRVQFSMKKKKTQSKTHPQDSSFCAAFIAIPFPSAHPFIQVSWTNTQLIINTVHHGQALLELWPPPLIMPVMSTPLISLVFDIPIDLPDVGHSESHAGCDRSWMPLRMLETSHLLYLIIHTDMIAGLIDAHAFGKKKICCIYTVKNSCRCVRRARYWVIRALANRSFGTILHGSCFHFWVWIMCKKAYVTLMTV